MFEYKEEINLEEFEAWSGGKDTLNLIISQGLLEEVEQYIINITCEEIPTKTEINDILWFDEYVNELIDWEI